MNQTPSAHQQDFDRVAASEEVYSRLFGTRNTTDVEPHPEFMQILRSVVFGDVFATGTLDFRTRELITVTVLSTLQTLPQLKVHTAAALKVGVTPVQLQESVYQLAPFLGFPRTLNALGTISEVFTERGVHLPLPAQGTVTETDRHARGQHIQSELYGDEIADLLADLPGEYGQAVPNFLTDFCFGDFWTRDGLDIATRELLILVALAAAGLHPQLKAHVAGAVRSGNSVETILAALVQGFPYMGLPLALNAIREVRGYLHDLR
ncbi:carboxymuconolactone decarboxylase family protein [Kocuria sp.]|uniref:carboxymuconolactone decarboxylase family protein n=1 Tax=Kocuria sp. TaxID=1871328 RepID=UPI0026DFD747|nr:carboxymuconolactone decarboxylase family protein [Kocuria sp.]MDO5618727.1 carboxymuconolactone decarboxylase family protein [Kocuria sp.]